MPGGTWLQNLKKIHAMWVILYLSFISLYSFPLNTESLT